MYCTCALIHVNTHMYSGYVLPSGGRLHFSQGAGPSTWHYPIYPDSQFSRGYHPPPPLGGHLQWQQAPPSSTRQVATLPPVPHSYQSGLVAPAQPTASVSGLHQGSELLHTVIIWWTFLLASWDKVLVVMAMTQ